MYLINTLLGFLIAQIYDIFTRDKNSEFTPSKFNLLFFLKDTWQKIALSLILSICISVAIHLNWQLAADMFSGDFQINDLIYLAVGAAPELLLQYFRKKAGFLQPKSSSKSGTKANM